MYVLEYNAQDIAGNAAIEVDRDVDVIDTTLPAITLVGNAAMRDDVDGDITASVVVGGDSVDTNTLGTYLINYNISDSSGNNAVQMDRTVEVIELDTQAPVITLRGETNQTVECGAGYIDPGATVSDNNDTGLVALVSGSVDQTTIDQ